jgi:hypothetical protein
VAGASRACSRRPTSSTSTSASRSSRAGCSFRSSAPTGRKAVFHFVGSDIRGKTPEQLAYAQQADARVVGSYDAIRWVPDADVIPPGIDLKRYVPTPGRGGERPLVVHAPSRKASKGTEFVEAACAQLPVDLDVVHGVTHDEAVERYRRRTSSSTS